VCSGGLGRNILPVSWGSGGCAESPPPQQGSGSLGSPQNHGNSGAKSDILGAPNPKSARAHQSWTGGPPGQSAPDQKDGFQIFEKRKC